MSAPQKWFSVWCVLIFSASLLTGCASSLVGNSAVQISPTSAVLLPGQQLQFTAVTGVPSPPQFLWEVNGVPGGSASTGTISTDGVYTAPSSPYGQPIQVSIAHQTAVAALSIYDPNHPSPGVVASTQNPLVASYSITIPMGASVQVQFGLNTAYGLETSAASSTTGGTQTIYVAGMLASTTYHMQAVVNLLGGGQVTDADHSFTTGVIPAGITPNISTQLTGAGTLSSGIELLSLTQGTDQNLLCALATDLAGNVIWYYPLPTGAYPFPIKQLPNGHMIMILAGTRFVFREIDLAGNIIRDLTAAEVNQTLSRIASFQMGGFTHDFAILPNGHYIFLVTLEETINNAPGIPQGTQVGGNALIDWDPQQNKAVWAWSTFDHLQLSHAPYGLSDWTHGNAIIYSPDDGNLIFSMRNQNWVVKINYQDGDGDGSILWTLGPGGDFTLPNQEAPIEWNYGQHYPSIVSSNSSGIFSLMFFNNGNDRLMDSNNDVCGTSGVGACYSSVPILQLNEYDKTASVLWEDNLSPAYSICCGDALVLPSGNVEFDVAYDQNTPNVSYIEEVTQTQAPELIWRMNITGQLAYRGLRVPSLYPGQVWPANPTQNVRPPNIPH
ncbi:MAG TPA: aryl-sulfate sulfotransferase [Candidatus Sulfotelmatobacter sp.]|nr:aryl-sulfate sulfotransferase [Candidatus Sulfotelmatobacter sp.]